MSQTPGHCDDRAWGSRRLNKHRTVSPPGEKSSVKVAGSSASERSRHATSKNKNVFQVQPCVSTSYRQSFVLQRGGSELAAHGYRIRCVASCGVGVEWRVVGATVHAVRDEDSGESCSLTLAARGVCQSLGIRKDALHSEAANQTKRRYLDLRFNGHWDNTSVVA